ncbi:recombinase family protein [Rhodococcus pseudokoreensis]|uniref:recombinase family protein n=1 Tax=Rhodococcus pseudokoreensis TaxID=2811421 RepID=UPI001F124CF7|nr:recombinase family protein [Rhodococcus pseudokoreensis]
MVHTLDRLGRTVGDTLNLIHDLHQRSIGFRNLAHPIRSDPDRLDEPGRPDGQLAVVLLALFGQMERTYAVAAHARTTATEKGRRTGRPSVVTGAQLAYATQLREGGAIIAEITHKTGLTLYRDLPPRSPKTLTADTPKPEDRKLPTPAAAFSSPTAGPSACPTCGYEPTTRRDLVPHRADLATIWLHLGDRGELREARYYARCQPHDSPGGQLLPMW